MKKGKIILFHFGVFVILSIAWFFSAETVLRKIAPELNYVEIWIKLVLIGVTILFILTFLSMLIILFRKKK